ncbi:MAG: hypothetical protein COA36_01400 [Desulfotalea sp.]|nr:MAG: hypothetical protein COA36_01400 [Desulfotalea sp.]
MNWNLIRNIAKWLWIFSILAFIFFYAINKRVLIIEMLGSLSLWVLLAATVLVISAKLCLVKNMCLAVRQFAIQFNFLDCFRVYNLTQMGKYIPGSIWQFVGRISVLHEQGISSAAIRDSMLAEHIWVSASACILAIVLLLLNGPEFIYSSLINYTTPFHLSWLIAIILLVILTVGIVLFKNCKLSYWIVQLSPPLIALPVLALTWFFLGASLWITVLPFASTVPPFFYVVGIYCFAYISGFVVPFAPAGLGIREAILVFALSPYVGSNEAILLAAVNRIIYFIVEVLLSGVALRIKMTSS